MPAQLLGDWLLHTSDPHPGIGLIDGGIQITLTAMSYRFKGINNPGFDPGAGDVVVNSTEIDFFNGGGCGLQLPDGVGRYTWTLTGVVLHFTALNQDPCPRTNYVADQSYTRTT